MANLTPEKRLDKHGRLVTRHVKTDTKPSSSLGSIPAPSLPNKSASKTPAPKTVQKRHTQIESRYADERLKAVYRYGYFNFTCSDAEAYEVMSVCDSSHTALRLLGAGMRTKEDAIGFLTENGMPDLHQDSSEDVEEAIRRGLPAVPALLAFNEYRSLKNSWPDTYFDAIEAHTVRVLKGTFDSPNRVPHLVLTDKIALSDIRFIGASRLGEASRKLVFVEDQLQRIHKGESEYGIEEFKELIVRAEAASYQQETILLARQYGADFVLGLDDLNGAGAFIHALPKKEYDFEQQKGMLHLNDELRKMKHYRNANDVALWYAAGVTAQEAADGLNQGMEPSAIAAIKEGINPTVSSGWL